MSIREDKTNKEGFINILTELVKTRPRQNKNVLERVLEPIMEDMEIFFEFIIYVDKLTPRNSKEFQYMTKLHLKFMYNPAYKILRYDAVVGKEFERYNEYRERNYGDAH
jgi:hypothetical protein